MPRTDTHRVSVADPAEYVECGYFDLHPEEGGGRIYRDVLGEYGVEEEREFSGNFEARGRCDHCGAGPLRYVVCFLHTPSGEIISVGERCASKLALESRSAVEHRRTIEEERVQRKRVEFNAGSPDNREAADYLDQLDGRDEFLNDLRRKLVSYGYLTERQVAAVLRSKEREAEYQRRRQAEAEELAQAEPLAEGRRSIVGVVLSTKWQESDFGSTLKMLVRQDDGNKVWGSVPESLQELTRPSWDQETGDVIEPELENLKGARVEFTATVERSRDDAHFGFFKRPSGARLAPANLFDVEEVS